MLHRSCTCGSHAALLMTVSPFAHTAAITAFSVPVTLASSSMMSAPCSPPLLHVIVKSLLLNSHFAPSASSAMMCVSTRRRPIRSPPGSGRIAFPNRPSSGPASSIDPRICWNSSGCIRPIDASFAHRRSVASSCSTVTPMSLSKRSIVPTSPMRGTFRSTTSPSVSSTAASSGSAAFLLPAGVTSPLNRRPPSMMNVSIASSFFAPPNPGLKVTAIKRILRRKITSLGENEHPERSTAIGFAVRSRRMRSLSSPRPEHHPRALPHPQPLRRAPSRTAISAMPVLLISSSSSPCSTLAYVSLGPRTVAPAIWHAHRPPASQLARYVRNDIAEMVYVQDVPRDLSVPPALRPRPLPHHRIADRRSQPLRSHARRQPGRHRREHVPPVERPARLRQPPLRPVQHPRPCCPPRAAQTKTAHCPAPRTRPAQWSPPAPAGCSPPPGRRQPGVRSPAENTGLRSRSCRLPARCPGAGFRGISRPAGHQVRCPG